MALNEILKQNNGFVVQCCTNGKAGVNKNQINQEKNIKL